MRLRAHRQRRRRAGIHQHHGAIGFDPLIARMGRVRDRRAARIVIGQDGGEQVGRRRPHAVEQGEAAVAMAEEAQHRHHPVDGVEEGLGGRQVAGREQLAQRQEIDQKLDQGARIAADMAAVRKDLPLQLVAQPLGGRAAVPGLPGHAQRRIGERYHGLQARHAVGRIRGDPAQAAHMPGQAANEAAVEADVGIVKQQGRLAEPGDDPPAQDLGAPGDRLQAAVRGDPFVHQRARIGTRDARIGGAQMPQPAEAQERDRPVLRRRGDLERRAGIAGDHLAGEHEAAGVDLACPGGVSGPQVLRRDDQAIGLGRERPIEQGVPARPADELASQAARHEHGQFGMFRDRNARHRSVRSLEHDTRKA